MLVQTCTQISLLPSMLRKGLMIPMMTCLPCLMLPMPVVPVVVCVGVYEKTVNS